MQLLANCISFAVAVVDDDAVVVVVDDNDVVEVVVDVAFVVAFAVEHDVDVD